jgi:ATP-dependent NAD(P)H-hydrate dehydratase
MGRFCLHFCFDWPALSRPKSSLYFLLSLVLYSTSLEIQGALAFAFSGADDPGGNFFISQMQRSLSCACKMMKVWEDDRDDTIRKTIPPLSSSSHKGSSGRVAVLGGSPHYTGAPYYAAISSLKAGADLVYVFTAQEASLPIKCYSPELVVVPVYAASEFDELVRTSQDESPRADELIHDMVDQVTAMMERLHSLVIGPGLGRCPIVFRAVAQIIGAARERGLHLIVDADALYMLALPEYQKLLKGYEKAVLTPNVVEYERLLGVCSLDSEDIDAFIDCFGSVTIVRKGKEDRIDVGRTARYVCMEEGGWKRSGGIGDILAGTLGTLTAWQSVLDKQVVAFEPDLPLACWAACCFVKRGTKKAYQAHRRSMTAPDVLAELGASIDCMTQAEI